jgi:hypothetical protein
LKRELDEVKWWENLVTRGVVKRQHAGYSFLISSRRYTEHL